MFAIVDDAAYGKVNGEEKSVGVLKFDKDPKDKIQDTTKETEAVQLVKIKK